MGDAPLGGEPCRTRLLVSVRSAAEARMAMEGGAALIDVKEPAAGPLGAADPRVVAAVVVAVAGRMPVSAALGELIDWPDSPWAQCDWRTAAVRAATDRLGLAKLGLAGCATDPSWPSRWAAALAEQPAPWAPVAVVYADWEKAAAPPPTEVHRHAVRLGCRALLVDTFDKSRGPLPDCWPLDRLHTFLQRVRHSGQLTVLGGSLTAEIIPDILPLCPDFIAVRGAVCAGNRTGPISTQRVRDLATAIAQAAGKANSCFVRP
jgi:uncharacterized protein (UPF0264 family)